MAFNSTFHYHYPDGLWLITRLRLSLRHLQFHKFNHNFFQDTLNPVFSFGTTKTNIHYVLHCPNFSYKRLTLFKKLLSIDENILSKDDLTFQQCFSLVVIHLMMWKILCFNCFNWIYTFNKTFWCSLISKLTHIYFFISSLFLDFYQEIALIFMFSLVFSIYTYNYLKSILLYLIGFWTDFCWLIPKHTKRYSAWWL